ncbi:MAG: hypothetical protein ABL888_11565 [Pirellulaceae bacterium]
MRVTYTVILILIGLLQNIGCRQVLEPQQTKSPDSLFAPYRMAPDCVAMEVAIAEFDADKFKQITATFAPFLDNQKVTLSQRQRWDRNGLQIGVITSQLPGELRNELETRDMTPEEMDELGLKPVGSNGRPLTFAPIIYHRRIQFRSNEPKPIPFSDFYPSATWTVNVDEGKSVGRDQHVRGWMLVCTQLGKGSSVDLKLTPRISHGNPHKKVGVVDQSFVTEESQAEIDLHPLSVNVTCNPGDTILIYGDAEADEIGELLLGNAQLEATGSAAPRRQRLVMFRLIHTQHDDLFVSPEYR